jgi:surface protein
MSYMFNGATAFNQDVSSWNTSKVTTMLYMLLRSHRFQQRWHGARYDDRWLEHVPRH